MIPEVFTEQDRQEAIGKEMLTGELAQYVPGNILVREDAEVSTALRLHDRLILAWECFDCSGYNLLVSMTSEQFCVMRNLEMFKLLTHPSQYPVLARDTLSQAVFFVEVVN